MIFVLQYALIVGGYAATAFLLGNYMKLYTGARDLELGFIFMIQPAVIIVRPFVCSLADRYQSHRTLYLYCSMVSVLAHIPFIVVPFVVEYRLVDEQLFTERVRFWSLVGCHFIGCVCFCCMRTLGDVLTVNYCKRIGSSYTKYRKYGPISFGVCSLALGYINTTSSTSVVSLGVPDYVPGFVLYTGFHLILVLLFYVWPEEHFVIHSDSQLDKLAEAGANCLPNRRETCQHISKKLVRLIACNSCRGSSSSVGRGELDNMVDSKQQLRIMLVLIRQEARIQSGRYRYDCNQCGKLKIASWCADLGRSLFNNDLMMCSAC